MMMVAVVAMMTTETTATASPRLALFNTSIGSFLMSDSETKFQLQVHQDSVKRKITFSQESASYMFVATGSLSNTDVSYFPMRSPEIS